MDEKWLKEFKEDAQALGMPEKVNPTAEEVDRALELVRQATAEASREAQASVAEFFETWAQAQGFGTAERAREAGFRLEPCSCCLPECMGWRVVRC